MIEQFRRGEEAGLKQIFQHYNRRLRYFALQYVDRPEIAEEIVSDTFIKIWERRNCFENENKLRSFLYTSVKNDCLNHLRYAETKRDTESIDEWEHLPCQDSDVLKKIVKAELLAIIYEELVRLPNKQREVFLLTFFECN